MAHAELAVRLVERDRASLHGRRRIRVTHTGGFIEEVRGDDPELAEHLRIEERELEAGGLN